MAHAPPPLNPPNFPGAFQNTTAPASWQAVRDQIDPAVAWNFWRVCQDDVHYEHQLYGYLNAYLGEIFPAHRRFTVHPQYMLRPVTEEGNLSIGSLGGEHRSRNNHGRETNKKLPDFLVTKSFPRQLNEPRAQLFVALVEVKLSLQAAQEDGPTDVESLDQVYDYLDVVAEYPHAENELNGFLVSPDRFLHVVRESSGTGFPTYRYYPSSYRADREYGYVFSLHTPLVRYLGLIAIAKWNRRDV
ncbi:hypothetical protein V5O48_009719 [Marasmius crinis-equi]|uniref:Uncharacterized protein n=1 Tax=Marasmius crinis-equi TaxID=585013 RepID=A0ABR3FAI9_9AGAR